MLPQKKITFDSFIRGVLSGAVERDFLLGKHNGFYLELSFSSAFR